MIATTEESRPYFGHVPTREKEKVTEVISKVAAEPRTFESEFAILVRDYRSKADSENPRAKEVWWGILEDTISDDELFTILKSTSVFPDMPLYKACDRLYRLRIEFHRPQV